MSSLMTGSSNLKQNSMRGGYGQGPTGASGLKGTGYKAAQMQNFSPEQMQLFQSMFGQVGPESYLGKLAGGDQSQFSQLEEPALRQFSQLQGGIASRFAGGGGQERAMSGLNSSGFKNTMNAASQDFAGQLQSQRMGIQRNALQDLMNMSNQLLGQRPYENFLIPKKKPWWQELLGSLAGGAGMAAGSLGGLYGANKLGFMGGE